VYLGDVEMRGSEVSTSVVKWSEGPINRMAIIFRNIYMAWSLLFIWLFRLSYPFIISVSILNHCIYVAVCFVCFCVDL
jgi:hypothetical protein